MNLDLHCHSNYSDGAHSPQFVLDRARANGVTHLALTDHDCIDGLLDLKRMSLPGDIDLIAGVEISSVWNNQEIHIVGLGIEPLHQKLQSLLQTQQEKRWQRMSMIAQSMTKAGVNGLINYLKESGCVSPSRSHVAYFLMQRGKVSSFKKAFKTLNRNGRYYVSPQWCTVSEAIIAIQSAGGFAVLAHPHRYPLNNRRIKSLVADFTLAGGDAMEVSYSNISNEDCEFLGKLCVESNLLASQGSDFHTVDATWKDIGKVRSLPASCTKNAIWLDPRWQSHVRNESPSYA